MAAKPIVAVPDIQACILLLLPSFFGALGFGFRYKLVPVHLVTVYYTQQEIREKESETDGNVLPIYSI